MGSLSKSASAASSAKSLAAGGAAASASSGASQAMFPMPHQCRAGESLCAQRMRQPSLPDLYRKRRRDEQRAAMNRALLSFSLALDMLCERDTEPIDTEETRVHLRNGEGS